MLIIDSAEVKRLMLERGLGVMKLSELARIPPKTISYIFAHGDKEVFTATLHRLAKALEVPPMSLLKAFT